MSMIVYLIVCFFLLSLPHPFPSPFPAGTGRDVLSLYLISVRKDRAYLAHQYRRKPRKSYEIR